MSIDKHIEDHAILGIPSVNLNSGKVATIGSGGKWAVSQSMIATSMALWMSNTSSGIAVTRATDKQREFYENIRYPAIYFDITAADDLGDGSLGKPYKNLTAARLKPGYRHLIKAGTTITTGAGDPWLAIPSTGTDQAPIIIGRYGDYWLANPIVNGAGASKVFRGSSSAKFWRIRDLEIIGGQAGLTNGTQSRFAVSQNSLDAVADSTITYGIVLARLKIHDVTTDTASDCNGIKLYGADNTILDCEIYNIATDAIWFHGYRTTVAGNKIYKVAQDGRSAGDCIQCGAKSDGSIVQGNYLDHSDVDIKQCVYFEQTVSISDSVLVEDNWCVQYNSNANGASPITCGATNSIVRRNYCQGGFVGIIAGEGTIAHNNLVIMTVGRGIDLKSNAKAYNNTIIQTGADTTQSWSVGIRIQSPDVGGIARNNVLIGMYNAIIGFTVSSTPNIIESDNAFAIRGVSDAKLRIDGVVTPPTNPTVGVWATWGADLGLDVNYRPVSSSVLINKSYPVPSLTDVFDKDQVPRTRNTIGAFD